mmetsp:Transcript_17513/g.26073  ORF Transcript_17513/g.26073 Transcript_17513/m.26073 type:complete len:149 (-) Transcript_17513:347-793(-)
MLPLLILVVPPTVIGGSYGMWYSGQKLVLLSSYQQHSTKKLTTVPPPQSSASYAAGLITLGGTYGLLQSITLGVGDSAVSSFSASSQSTKTKVYIKEGGYQPPQTLAELKSRIGAPLLKRMGIASIAFFVAGSVQTYVALHYDNSKRR